MRKLPIARLMCGLGVATVSLALVATGRGDEKTTPPSEVASTPGPMILSNTPHPCHIPPDLHDKAYERFADVLVLAEA